MAWLFAYLPVLSCLALPELSSRCPSLLQAIPLLTKQTILHTHSSGLFNDLPA